MSWRDRPMAGFDTETTGVDVETARIVTACVGLATPQGWTARNWLLTQDTDIPAEAIEIHGITTEHANEHGEDPAGAVAAIRDDLYKAWSLGMPIVGYNAVFDLTILDRELRRHSLGGLDVRGPVLDPLVIDKAIDRYRRGSRKLIDTCTYYGIALTDEDAHGAEADARATCRLAWKLAGKPWRGTTGRGQFMAMCGTPLPELHAWQADQYRMQREQFAEYLARKGERLDDPSTDWPLRPAPNPATAAA
jgi:DNA polymerase-3 subunit epsilon